MAGWDLEHPFALDGDTDERREQRDREIHKRIAARMKELGVTQEQLREGLLGKRGKPVSRAHVSKMLAEPSRLDGAQARALVVALDCTGDYLRGAANHVDGLGHLDALTGAQAAELYEKLDRERRHVASEVIVSLWNAQAAEQNARAQTMKEALMGRANAQA